MQFCVFHNLRSYPHLFASSVRSEFGLLIGLFEMGKICEEPFTVRCMPVRKVSEFLFVYLLNTYSQGIQSKQ